jgi:hypothetical protein
MRIFVLIVAVVIGSLLGGCMFKQIREQDIIGKYQADLPDGGTVSLELLPQGECIQIIRLKNGAI